MRCLKCNQFFQEVAWISYQEYSGASYQQEPVSPCCHSQYEEDDQAQIDAFADAEIERQNPEYAIYEKLYREYFPVHRITLEDAKKDAQRMAQNIQKGGN